METRPKIKAGKKVYSQDYSRELNTAPASTKTTPLWWTWTKRILFGTVFTGAVIAWALYVNGCQVAPMTAKSTIKASGDAVYTKEVTNFDVAGNVIGKTVTKETRTPAEVERILKGGEDGDELGKRRDVGVAQARSWWAWLWTPSPYTYGSGYYGNGGYSARGGYGGYSSGGFSGAGGSLNIGGTVITR